MSMNEPANPPCDHRGEQVDLIECPTCGGTVKLKVFVCAVHQKCTIGKMMPGMGCCTACYDRKYAAGGILPIPMEQRAAALLLARQKPVPKLSADPATCEHSDSPMRHTTFQNGVVTITAFCNACGTSWVFENGETSISFKVQKPQSMVSGSGIPLSSK